MSAPQLAVDLSSQTLRVVEGVPGSYMRCGEAGMPAGALQDGRVVDQAAVAQSLRQLVARTEITATRALIAASDNLASFRVLSFPGDATNADVDSAVKTELDLGSDRMARLHIDVPSVDGGERLVFAAVWDRRHVEGIAGAVRQAGLEPQAVDLKSMCLARALTVESCLLVDLTGTPCEVVLVDGRLPRVWHAFDVNLDGDVAASVAASTRPVVGLNQRYGSGGFGPESPIVVRADPALPADVTGRIEQLTGRSVLPVPVPPRIGPDVRYIPYLTCLGLIMRRHP